VLSIPEGLHQDPARRSIEVDRVWVIDYVSDRPSLTTPVVVTRPTFVFVHEGVKELTTTSHSEGLLASAGSVVSMRTGTHVTSDLLPVSARYASTILSVERDQLVSMLDGRGAEPTDVRAVVSEIDESVRLLAHQLRSRLANAPTHVERKLAVKQILASLLLDGEIRQLVSRDVAGWGNTNVGRVEAVMGAHCYSPLRLDQYASMCAMSVSSFKRAFREAYKQSPGKWLTEIRLQYAANLLRSRSDSVTDVSTNCGFGDLSNFTRSFRKRFGVSPSAYRQAPRVQVAG
jgi:AraC-like DNA-binding protein